MEVFVLILFVPCDDYYGHYTYVENLNGVYSSFEEAKLVVDKMVIENENENPNWPYDGGEYYNFLRIIKMTLGDQKKEIVYDSSTFMLDATIHNEKQR